MQVDVEWTSLCSPANDVRWDYDRCLYAYTSPQGEIIYIGMAWNATVDQRWIGKRGLWQFLADEGVRECAILLGEVYVQGRLTRQLLSDVESLLIFHRVHL